MKLALAGHDDFGYVDFLEGYGQTPNDRDWARLTEHE